MAREAGHRSKIAVRTKVPGLNAKGACIGPMGQRVRNVMSELHGEKIDIVDWSDDPATFVASALSPARVTSATVVDPQAKAVRVVVPDYQLSLAIGKEGPERPPGRAAHRLPDRHPQRRAGRRRRRDARRPGWAGRRCGPALPAGLGRRADRPRTGPPPRRAEHPGPATR